MSNPRDLHPLLQENYTGVKTARLWNYFFCCFLLRLSENNCSRTKFIAKFGPTASNFGYIILTIFGSRFEPSCDHSEAGLDLNCSSFWGLNSDDFLFFTSCLGPLLEPELARLKIDKKLATSGKSPSRWHRLLMPRLHCTTFKDISQKSPISCQRVE